MRYLLIVCLLFLHPGRGASAQIDPELLTGRDFAGVLFPDQPRDADLSIATSRAWVWNVDPSARAGGSPTQRISLVGDVQVTLGSYRFTASRASVWLQNIAPQGSDPVRQVAIYFDRVADPAAQASVSYAADRLLVTGVLAGDLSIRADILRDARPAPSAFLAESEARLARYLASITDTALPVPTPRTRPADRPGPIQPGISRPFEPDSPFDQPADPVPTTPMIQPTTPIFSGTGVISFTAGHHAPADTPSIRLIDNRTILLSSGVVLEYADSSAPLLSEQGVETNPNRRNLQMRAERAVIFLTQDALESIDRFSAQDVEAIYLEGGFEVTDQQRSVGPGGVVVAGAEYTLRSPRVFYDVQNDRAHLVDAVFSTFDQQRGVPLYLRAKALRQLSKDTYSARSARLSTSSFAEPHLSIGASEITITQRQNPAGGSPQTFVDAKDLTIRAGSVPFFYYPRFDGRVRNVPLTEFGVSNSSSSGTAVRTAWDFFGLTGFEPPRGLDAELLLDLYFDRGPALGFKADWSNDTAEGDVFVYTLPQDNGEDRLSSGVRRGRDHEFRGVYLFQHRWDASEEWTVFLEGAFFSDENVLDAFFRPIAQTSRELTNRALFRRQDDNSALYIQAQGDINDFTPNQYLLQSRGYSTQKLPGVSYFVEELNLLPDEPGLLTYSAEYHADRLKLNFTEPTADELGFNTARRADRFFGISPDQSPADALRAQGLTESDTYRIDTRQQLTADLGTGPFEIKPFVAGRATAYSREFDDYSRDAESSRLWGSVGVSVSATLSRVYDNAQSRLLDIDRIRHIVTPNLTAWWAGADLSENDLPVYDERVESLATGSTVRLGVQQTLQTMRGGPGRQRSVDFVTLDTNLVLSSEDAYDDTQIGRYFDSRPEYSNLGNYVTNELTWQITDATAFALESVYDFERNQPAYTSIGGIIDHSQNFRTSIALRTINPRDATYLDLAGRLKLTDKWSITNRAVYDTERDEFQSLSATFDRELPSATIGVSVRYNQVRDETSVGVRVRPNYVDQRLTRLRELRDR